MKRRPPAVEPGEPGTDWCRDTKLRGHAEKTLSARAENARRAQAGVAESALEDAPSLLHELRVHQIELEMQNEELRRGQYELEASRERYRELYDLAPVGYLTLSEQGLIRQANLTAADLLGVARAELIGRSLTQFISTDDQDVYYLHRKALFGAGQPQSFELLLLGADGTPLWTHIDAVLAHDGLDGEPVYRATFTDIGERKAAEETLRESQERYREIIETLHEGIWAIDVQGVTTLVNPCMAEMLGRHLLDFMDAAERELAAGKLERRRQGISEKHEFAFRRKDGTPVITSLKTTPLYDEKSDYVGRIAGVRDITERRAGEKALRENAAQLRTALHDTVKSMGAIVALRDPYTGRHEVRVNCLAEAIAIELGLDESRREGLSIAARVHDVGMIGIPAEILSKPAQLSATEFTLVQQHAVLGRDVLSTIAFAWPVAEMVHQHHERLDGSGYPQGLKGEQIMLEARIIGVADVVEAMASHRPYRPALGIEAVLAEVREGAGTRYDAGVVAACERVIAAGTVDLSEEAPCGRPR